MTRKPLSYVRSNYYQRAHERISLDIGALEEIKLQSFYRTGELLAKGTEESNSREPHANNPPCQTLPPLSKTQDLEMRSGRTLSTTLGRSAVLLPADSPFHERVNVLTSPPRIPVPLHETRIG